MKKIIRLFIFYIFNFFICLYAQPEIIEMNSGVNTELTSSSNCIWTFGHGWACGVNGTVIRTSAYNNWINVSGNGIPANVTLDNICATDTLLALTAGHLDSNTWVWKTTNGGQSWFQVFNQPHGRINAIWMKSLITGFMVGNPVGGRWSLWKTYNAGTNWDSTGIYLPQSGNESGWPNSLSIQSVYGNDSNRTWFGTNNYRIYYSTNYGQSWIAQSTVPEQNIYCMISGVSLIYAGGSNYLLKSTNFGSNWTIDSVGGTGDITGITQCVWSMVLCRGNQLYANSFMSYWHPVFTAPAGVYSYVDNHYIGNGFYHFAVRSNGGITSLWEGEGVQKISSEIPNGFKLSQNYPNPFNPKSIIKFQIAKANEIKLVIFDILGREIATLVNKPLSPGTYEVEWDGTNYPSGVYFYKLITSDFFETRKMVLIK
jgi:hypothetical protein